MTSEEVTHVNHLRERLHAAERSLVKMALALGDEVDKNGKSGALASILKNELVAAAYSVYMANEAVQNARRTSR